MIQEFKKKPLRQLQWRSNQKPTASVWLCKVVEGEAWLVRENAAGPAFIYLLLSFVRLVVMKLSARYHFLIIVVLTTYFFLNIKFRPKPPSSVTGHSRNNDNNNKNNNNITNNNNKNRNNSSYTYNKNIYARTPATNKKSFVFKEKSEEISKSRKIEIMERLRELIVNYTASDAKIRMGRKKSVKPTPNNNYRLSRLLYQLWDPNR